ncbi:DUF4157 domain-containing protein [Synechococcus sp. PCC 7336]|uniref:eCIS core domain-containing protein n=1 Tax=Synechococcus sp. PCC 7336 TaxID=195250 RepID=UPI001D0CF161|nr:DUF4157 domain-containing protein [Synechococcus sp. PCC 7336]
MKIYPSNFEPPQMVQAKLAIRAPGDKHEQEADLVARQVVSRLNTPEPQQTVRGKALQRVDLIDDNELRMKPKIALLQRVEMLDEEELQMKESASPQQLELTDEDDKLQMKSNKEAVQRMATEEDELQQKSADSQQAGVNKTGMPARLKTGLEQLSGLDLSGMRVHYNSAKPAQLNALAYTQGQTIEVSPGQERHLAHEGWHAVQQMQGRVKPTIQAKEVAINDDKVLEHEADVMGAKATQIRCSGKSAFEFPIHSKAIAQADSLAVSDLRNLYQVNANCPEYHAQLKMEQLIQAKAPSSQPVIQRVIPENSTKGVLSDMNLMDNLPITEATKDMGSTGNPPTGAAAPQYTIDIQTFRTGRGKRYKGKLRLTQRANEGDVTSMYVGAGTYNTHFKWVPDDEVRFQRLDPATTPVRNRLTTLNRTREAINFDEVYVNVSSRIANLSRLAEVEHLDDIRHAYQISLYAAETAINKVIEDMPKDGFEPIGGRTGFKSEESTRSYIEKLIFDRLPDSSSGLSRDQSQWLRQYLNLSAMTQNRDNQSWHYFDIQSSGWWYNNKVLQTLAQILDEYGGVDQETPANLIHYVDVVIGDTLAIGQYPSNEVVHF